MIDASTVKIIANDSEIIIEKAIEISLIPNIEYRNPLIIQYKGFINAIYAQDSGNMSIDQNTPPSIDKGINTKVPHTPTESQVFETIPTITPIAPNAHETTIKKNSDRK